MSPAAATSRSPTLLLSFPAEIIRLIFNLGANSFLPRLGFTMLSVYSRLHRERDSFLMNASLVHPLWKAQAQAELVTLVYCTGTARLLGMADFLEQSKQVHLLRTLGIDVSSCRVRQEHSESSVEEVDKMSARYADNPQRAPLWFGAKKLMDLGVQLDTLEIFGRTPGKRTWEFLHQIPTCTLILAHMRFRDELRAQMDAPSPLTSRLVLACDQFPTDSTLAIFGGPSKIIELVLFENVKDSFDNPDRNLFWAPLVPTVTSMTIVPYRSYIEAFSLNLFLNVKEIGFFSYDYGDLKSLENLRSFISSAAKVFPNLRQFVLPVRWGDTLSKQLVGPGTKIHRRHNPGELSGMLSGTSRPDLVEDEGDEDPGDEEEEEDQDEEVGGDSDGHSKDDRQYY